MNLLLQNLIVLLVFVFPDILNAQNSNLDSLKLYEYYIGGKLVSRTEFFRSENENMELTIDFEENTIFLKVLSKQEEEIVEVNYLNNQFIDSSIYRYEDGMLKEKEVIILPELHRALPNPFTRTEKVLSLYNNRGEIIKSLFIDHHLGDTMITNFEMLKIGEDLIVEKSITDSPKFKMGMTMSKNYPLVNIDSFYYVSGLLVRTVSYSNDKFQTEVSYKYDTNNRLIERLQINNSITKRDTFSYIQKANKFQKVIVSTTETRGMTIKNTVTSIYHSNERLLKEIESEGIKKVSERVLKYDHKNRLVLEQRYRYTNGKERKLHSKKIYQYIT